MRESLPRNNHVADMESGSVSKEDRLPCGISTSLCGISAFFGRFGSNFPILGFLCCEEDHSVGFFRRLLYLRQLIFVRLGLPLYGSQAWSAAGRLVCFGTIRLLDRTRPVGGLLICSGVLLDCLATASGCIACLPWDWSACLHYGQEHSQREIFHGARILGLKLYACRCALPKDRGQFRVRTFRVWGKVKISLSCVLIVLGYLRWMIRVIIIFSGY